VALVQRSEAGIVRLPRGGVLDHKRRVLDEVVQWSDMEMVECLTSVSSAWAPAGPGPSPSFLRFGGVLDVKALRKK